MTTSNQETKLGSQTTISSDTDTSPVYTTGDQTNPVMKSTRKDLIMTTGIIANIPTVVTVQIDTTSVRDVTTLTTPTLVSQAEATQNRFTTEAEITIEPQEETRESLEHTRKGTFPRNCHLC